MLRKVDIMFVGIQAVGVFFGLVMIYLTFLYYKKNNYSTRSFVLWLVIWVGYLIGTILPETLYGIMEELKIQRTVDFFVIAGFMFLTIIIFYLYTTIKVLEQKIQLVVRKVAVDNPETKKSSKKKN